MAIQPLNTPTRTFGEPIPVAPDTNAEVDKINELVAAVNAGLATSNAIVGGDKFVQYLSSGTYGVPAQASTLDRLDPATILPGVEATVINPAPTPLTVEEPSKSFVATIVADGTTNGAFQVPAYTGATDLVWVVWQEVVSADSFTPILPIELDAAKASYAGMALRPLLIKIIGALGTATTVTTTQPTTTTPATGPTVTGFLPSSAAVGASVTITGTAFTKATAVLFNGTPASFQLINATTLVAVVPVDATTGPVAVTNSAGTGTSAASFTVSASTTTPPTTPTADLTAALAISVATLMLGSPVAYSITPTAGTAPYAYEVVATDTTTGQQFTLGTTRTGSWTPTAVGSYAIEATVTDSSNPAKVAQTATRYLQVSQAVNRIPVADAGQDLTIQLPTSSVALMGTASDPDGDALTYDWRQVTGPAGAPTATGLPATTQNVVVSNLMAGTYQFGFRSTDSHGAQSPEDYVLLTVNPVATTPTTIELAPFGNSRTADENHRGYITNWPAKILGLLADSRYTLPFNYALGGSYTDYGGPAGTESSVTTQLAAYAAQVHAAVSQRVAIIAIGINDCQNLDSFSTIIAHYTHMMQVAKADTSITKIILVNLVTSRYTGFDDARQQQIFALVQQVNQWLENNYLALGASVLCDVYSDRILYGYDAPLNQDNFIYSGTDNGIHYQDPAALATAKVIKKGVVLAVSGGTGIVKSDDPFVPAAIATPIYLDASNPNNTATMVVDSGAGKQNATIYGSPQLVPNAVFGKAAYYFPNDGILRYLELRALASQANAYTITFVLRSTATNASQFYFDCETGRIVLSANGFSATGIGPGAYYASAQPNQPSGARGNTIPAQTDSIISVALGADNGVVFLNGVKQGEYAASITRLSTKIRIGAKFDATPEGYATEYADHANTVEGFFFGYIQAAQFDPGKATDAEMVAIFQKYSGGNSGGGGQPISPNPQTAAAFTANGLVYDASKFQYSTTDTSGGYNVLAVAPLTFPAGTESVASLIFQTGDQDVIYGFCDHVPSGPADMQFGIFPTGGDIHVADRGYFGKVLTPVNNQLIQVHRAANGLVRMEVSGGGAVYPYSTNSTATLQLYLFIRGAATSRLTAPGQVGGVS
jgi:hypothetical protein